MDYIERKCLFFLSKGDPVLQMFLQPAHETVSVKILKKMGWKPGKGVGEKVTRKEKRAAKKVYTCYVPAEFRVCFKL